MTAADAGERLARLRALQFDVIGERHKRSCLLIGAARTVTRAVAPLRDVDRQLVMTHRLPLICRVRQRPMNRRPG